ncbi:hypothetical protein [Actinomadura rubrisoli]|uniref:Uncharacterized protein n=1 Tax=Actinomadura rubrisoli TaxID=2530368 RepID=A0A4R5BHV2_9ACTN|nr:hypothetical protein [Actinomadura rubrisoli]TDD83292.1 hypothetical protein E1298_21495 [Actinomadura rubrisoli]
MTAGPQSPDETWDESQDEGGESPERVKLRPLDRRVIQAMALAALVPAFLSLQWLDEERSLRSNLKPREKVITVAHGAVGEFGGARWRLMGRENAASLADPASAPGTSPPGGTGAGDVTELRLTLAVRPLDAAGAKTVGSYGTVYRLRDGDGHVWSATGLALGTPRQGVPTRITVRATVPRAKVDSLVLEVRPPAYPRPKGPLPLLRFAP